MFGSWALSARLHLRLPATPIAPPPRCVPPPANCPPDTPGRAPAQAFQSSPPSLRRGFAVGRRDRRPESQLFVPHGGHCAAPPRAQGTSRPALCAPPFSAQCSALCFPPPNSLALLRIPPDFASPPWGCSRAAPLHLPPPVPCHSSPLWAAVFCFFFFF